MSQCKDHLFTTTIRSLSAGTGCSEKTDWIAPEEVAQIAFLISSVTGDSTQPYRLKVPDLPTPDTTPAINLFAYRNSARKFQFKTRISSVRLTFKSLLSG